MKTTITASIFFALLATASLGSASRAGSGRVSFEAAFAAPALDDGAQGLTAVEVSGTSTIRTPGAPMLPYRTVRLALPPDADPATAVVTVTPLAETPIPGSFDIAPAPPARRMDDGRAVWGDAGPRIAAGRDTAIYASDALFPSAWGEAVGGVQTIRGYRAIEVALHPVRYRPSSGRLVAASGLRIEVRYRATAARAATPGRRCRAGDALAARLIDNFAEAAPWYATTCALVTGDGVAVITTDDLADGSALLDDWVALREEQGHTVVVATEADWDETTGDEAEDGRADRIRKWLVDNFETLDLGWVLLIGNPDPSEDVVYSIPMKPCGYYEGDYGTDTGPTDFYYADLTSDFDADGDGTYCETQDGVSFVPDVYVGRLPVYSDGPAAVDEMLARILAYEDESVNGDLAWRRRMLLPDSIYFYKGEGGDTSMPRWDGATIGEWFIRDELVPRGMVWTTLYEREGYQPSQFTSHFALNSQNVVDQWVRGYGFVYWAGHGSETGVYRTIWLDDANGNGYLDETVEEYGQPEFMTQSYTFMLEDAPPPFVVHGSCSNATPEYSENLAYNILRRGAIATLAATRSALTWHWPEVDPEVWVKPDELESDVTDMTTEYAHNILEGYEAGKAHGDMMAATNSDPWGGENTPYQKSIQNLYGDPLVRLVMCRESVDCDNGSFCDGIETCDFGSCRPGTAIVCGPTDACAEMVCDDEVDTCVPAASCIADAGPIDTDSETDTDTDTATDAGPSVTDVGASGGGCNVAPATPSSTTLFSALL